MEYDFNKITDRKGTAAIKWDYYREFLSVPHEIVPLWVADMDFETAPEISRALQNRAAHPIYGYTARPAAYYSAVKSWFYKRYSWTFEKDHIHFTPGIVTAMCMAIGAFTEPGDKIVVQTPVYNPFFDIVKANGRMPEFNPLINKDGKYLMDYEALEESGKNGAKMLLLCNPHNPVGRVWSKEELRKVCEICERHDMLIISDEIHGDLTMPGILYTPLMTVDEKYNSRIISCTAPSKTFNIPGLKASNIIISDERLSKAFREYTERLHLGMSNIFAIEGAAAAYAHGGPWLESLRDYLFSNAEYVAKNLTQKTRISTYIPEGTYLMWLDFSAYGLDHEDLNRTILDKARVGLSNGTMYGGEGEGFMRMNIGCPRAVLEEACDRLGKVFK